MKNIATVTIVLCLSKYSIDELVSIKLHEPYLVKPVQTKGKHSHLSVNLHTRMLDEGSFHLLN